MHERSLVKTIIEQVRDEARIRQLGRIHEVQLQIGEFTGIEPRLVESAFAEMSPEYWDTDVRLRIEVVPLKATCQLCNEHFHIESFRFICPQCGHGEIRVTDGEDMRLVNLVVERQTVSEGLS